VKQMGSWFSKMSASSSTESFRIVTHVKCRNANYPRTENPRFEVPDAYVKWETPFDGYKPHAYTAESIIGKPWADPEYEFLLRL